MFAISLRLPEAKAVEPFCSMLGNCFAISAGAAENKSAYSPFVIRGGMRFFPIEIY